MQNAVNQSREYNMDTSRVNENLEQLENMGFITNCPPDKNLYVVHDDVNKYCRLLNSHICDFEEEPLKSVHLNEPAGDFIAIYKPSYYKRWMYLMLMQIKKQESQD